MNSKLKGILRLMTRLGCHLLSSNITNKCRRRSCLVFSPHPDDETLGCGGTIIKKRQSATPVKVVFMADGRSSHQSSKLRPDELAERREAEAREAGQILGLNKEDICFLRYPDRGLFRYQVQAKERVVEIIEDFQPEEIFVPYAKEAHTDHLMTRQIVLEAINEVGCSPRIYEYPIWYWTYWPWNTPKPLAFNSSGVLKRRITAFRRGLITLTDPILELFLPRCAVEVGDVLKIKREALSKYKTQMTRVFDEPSWATLDGEWLKNFFFRYELFFTQPIGRSQ
ncbi:MAG: PIG-L family deacetylase [bacterium]